MDILQNSWRPTKLPFLRQSFMYDVLGGVMIAPRQLILGGRILLETHVNMKMPEAYGKCLKNIC